jgi:K+-dependent Na+/Ca+ exchanger-like protein
MSVLIAIILIGLLLYLLAIITEEFFVPAIDTISHKLKLSGDAAGATLLAIGSSAPEFFTAIFAVFGIAGAEADFGAGTIVGSAIFNILVIVGVAAMFKAVVLQWQPVIRDLLFYIISILLLLFVFRDGVITPYEAGLFLFVYLLYVVSVIYWRRILDYKDIKHTAVHTDDESRNFINKVTHRTLGYIIPNPKSRSLGSFTVSILLIAALSWLLVEQIMVLSHVLNINPVFLALTVLAAGTSIPDLISSIVVARQGRGDMAVSNAVGSNIFDILFTLGFAWMLLFIVRGTAEPIYVSNENLAASILLLFATVVSLLFLLFIRRWKIGSKSGILLIALYISYCIYIFISL